MPDTPSKKTDRASTALALCIICFGGLAVTNATVWLIQNIRAMLGW